jgi:hypothetical protein
MIVAIAINAQAVNVADHSVPHNRELMRAEESASLERYNSVLGKSFAFRPKDAFQERRA